MGLLSRLEVTTRTKGPPFVPVGGSTRDKRPNPFIPVGASNQDKRPLSPRWLGLPLDPGQKPPIVSGPKAAGTNGLEQRLVL